MSPGEKIIGHILGDELSREKEFNNGSAEAFGYLGEVAEWNVDEVAILIKTAFQNDGVPVGIEAQELTERLEAQQGSCFYSSVRRFVEIALDHGEDEPAQLGKELSVMAEEHSQAFGETKRDESMWKTQEKINLRVLGEQEGSFL